MTPFESIGIGFFRYTILLIKEDNDDIVILYASNDLDFLKEEFDKTVDKYKNNPIITEHYEIVLLDYDRDAEIKSYDSRTDIC